VAAGDLDAIAFIQGMSPVAWQHVNMFGSFEFSNDEQGIDLDALAAQYADSVFWRRYRAACGVVLHLFTFSCETGVRQRIAFANVNRTPNNGRHELGCC